MADVWTRIMAQAGDRQWPTVEAFAADWAGHMGLQPAHAQTSAAFLLRQYGGENRVINFSESERWNTAQALNVLSSQPAFQMV
jgi:hypothetical protein